MVFHNRDKPDIHFRNAMDKNYFVFHNCPDDYVSKSLDNSYFKEIGKTEILRYNGISYTQSLLQTLHRCKSDGVKYLFFLQDDVFSQTDTPVIDELLTYVRSNTFNMLNIEEENIRPSAPVLFSGERIKVYDTTSTDFKAKKLWAFDDGSYVADIDYLLTAVYDPTYFLMNDIWKSEGYLNNEITKKPIQRLSLNVCVFRRVNIIGMNSWNRKNELAYLNTRFHQ